MAVRSIIFFDVLPGHEERFATEFTGLKAAEGFPGFLGGEFARSVREPNIFTVTALWESATAYANWQSRFSAEGDEPSPIGTLIAETLVDVPSGKPYEVLHTVAGSSDS